MSGHIKHYQKDSYIVAMYKAQFSYRKTHRVLTLSIPAKESGHPVEIRRRRLPNEEASQAYSKAVNWINARA
jgi:hypothetical protein